MSLRIKTRIIVTATLLGLLATLYLVTRHTLLPRFAELEDAEVRGNTERASTAIWHEAALLNSTVRDDAIWDEAYTFVQKPSVEWVSSSFSDDGYRYLRLNLMVYSDVHDDPVWAREFDPSVGKQVPMRPEILPIIRRLAQRARTSGTLDGISGIVRLPDGPMVISTAPVLPSSGRGTALGSLVMGRRLDAAELADLAKTTNLPITAYDYRDPNLPPDLANARARLSDGRSVFIEELSPDSIAGFTVLKDLDGKPTLLVRTENRRAIFHQGEATLVYLMMAALVVGIAFSLVTLVLFEKLVVSRLIGLSSSVGGVAAQPHRTARVAVEGSDEVSQLGVAINRMLSALANSQEKHQLQSAFLEQLFESAPEAIAILDRNDVVMRVNQEFCRMFGYSGDEVVGRSIADLITTDDQREHATSLARDVASGKTISLEARRRKKDGTWLDVSILGTPITTDGGQVAVYAIYRDVGEKKRSEALQTALYQIAEKASSTEDLPQLYTAIHSILRRLMYAKNCYIAEYDPATDMVSFPYFVDEKDPPFPPHKFGHGFTEYVLRTGQPLLATADVLEELIRRGEVHRIGSASSDWLGVPLKQADKVFGVLTVQSYDPKVRYTQKDKEILTFVSQQIASAIAQKRNQEAVRISEANFRSLAENASPAIFIYDERRFLYVNPSSERMFGYTRQELLAMADPWEIIHPESREVARQMASAKTRADVAPKGEFRILKKSGDSRWVELSTSIIQFGGKPANVATAIDITERKRSEQLQSALYQIANLSSTTGDLPSLYRSIHQIVGELMDAKNFYIALADFRSETIEFPYFVDEVDLVPPEAPLAIGRGLTGYVLHTGEPLLATPEVFEQLVKSGDVESVGAPSVDWLGVPLKKGDQTFGVLVVQSYTENVRYGQRDKEILTFVSQQVASAIEHRRDQDALRASEARYRTLVEGAEYGIFQSTLENRFIDANPALVEMLGYASKEEVLALHVGKDVYAETVQRDQILALLKAEGRFRGVEARWKRRDGTLMTVRLSGRTFTDTTGEMAGFEGIAEDITERRLLEDQLRQSQKMEAVGQLAGGIAHDFNNLLTIIKGNSELLLDDLGETDPRRVEVDEIQKAASRAAGMTQQLLAFSRRQVRAPKVLDLNQVVTNMEKLLHRLLGEQVELCTVCAKDLSSVKADPGQVEQVIMNLALNARDAMPNGGKLTIETANVDLDESYDREHFNVKPGKYVLLAVSDTGEGMDAETLAHAFEPFFTTKPVGKGTGLGLSTVYGIVKQSDGYIWGYSEVGIGTTFKVYLPCTQTAVQDAHMPRPAKDYEGSEQILVVEDEDGVRGLICQVLRRKGYTVLEARNGQEAIAACSQNGSRRPDLLVTDVVLPQMSGREIADRITAMIPDVRVLYISGYTDDAVLKHGVLNTGTAFLQKPFTTEALLEKVREVLRMPAAGGKRRTASTHA